CQTISAVERTIERAVESHGIRLACVDYAQLIQGRGETKEQRVSDVSTRLKSLAMKHELIVLLLCQLNRQLTVRSNQIPELSDLRDSGGLEQDCDVCLMLHWPWKLSDTYKPVNEYRVYCRKNRNRGIGEHVVTMRVRPDRQRLEPWDSNVPDSF